MVSVQDNKLVLGEEELLNRGQVNDTPAFIRQPNSAGSQYLNTHDSTPRHHHNRHSNQGALLSSAQQQQPQQPPISKPDYMLSLNPQAQASSSSPYHPAPISSHSGGPAPLYHHNQLHYHQFISHQDDSNGGGSALVVDNPIGGGSHHQHHLGGKAATSVALSSTSNATTPPDTACFQSRENPIQTSLSASNGAAAGGVGGAGPTENMDRIHQKLCMKIEEQKLSQTNRAS